VTAAAIAGTSPPPTSSVPISPNWACSAARCRRRGWSFPAPDEDAVTGYPEELRDFIHAIATGGQPRSGLMLACDLMLMVYAAYLSADERREVDLRPHLQPWGDP
jgi:hypothetical protein